VKVISPYGQISWNGLSRISDEEMKALMLGIVNKVFTFLVHCDYISDRPSRAKWEHACFRRLPYGRMTSAISLSGWLWPSGGSDLIGPLYLPLDRSDKRTNLCVGESDFVRVHGIEFRGFSPVLPKVAFWVRHPRT
jgi:hypothetical protein